MKILVIGATSAIAQACIRQWAEEGHELYLIARNKEKLKVISDDVSVRENNACKSATLDANDFKAHESCLKEAIASLGCIDICLIAYGELTQQKICENNPEDIISQLNTNALSVISLATYVINQLIQQNNGTLAIITSVAGDRARKSNYIYGIAKSTISKFLEGLRHRFAQTPIKIIDIKPGFVDTPMTEEFTNKNFLWAKPEKVANDILKGIAKNRAVIYTPFFWYYIMQIIKALPLKLFNKIDF